MKEVYVIRHGNWDLVDDGLTEEGKKACLRKAESFPKFAAVYSSPLNRAQQTASLLSGSQPIVDERAATPKAPAELSPQIAKKRKTNPQGVAGALFEIPEARPALQEAGALLGELIKHALNRLHDGDAALIVSHDGTMVAAERILEHEPFDKPLDHTYRELEGFITNDGLAIKPL